MVEDHITIKPGKTLAAVRWFDNHAVTFSTETGHEPEGVTKRWNKVTKNHADVPMPAFVGHYNKLMGGANFLEGFLARYRFLMKSQRWYIYLFWHYLLIGLVNAWNLYRRDYKLLGLPEKKMLNRRRFQAIVVEGLTKVEKKASWSTSP